MASNIPAVQTAQAPLSTTATLQPRKDDPLMKPSTSENLENIILNFDAAGAITDLKDGHLNLSSNKFSERDPDMVF